MELELRNEKQTRGSQTRSTSSENREKLTVKMS